MFASSATAAKSIFESCVSVKEIGQEMRGERR